MRIGGSWALAKRIGRLSAAAPAAEPLISERRDVVSDILILPGALCLKFAGSIWLARSGVNASERWSFGPNRRLRAHRNGRSGRLRPVSTLIYQISDAR